MAKEKVMVGFMMFSLYKFCLALMSPLTPYQMWVIVDYSNMVGNGVIPVHNARKENTTLIQAVFVP